MDNRMREEIAQHIPLDFAVGFGLHATWVSNMFYQWAPLAEPIDSLPFSNLYLASIAVHITTLVILAIVSKVSPSKLSIANTPASFAVMALATGIGSALAILASSFSWSPSLLVVEALLTGVGSACILMIWGCKLAELNGRAIAGLCTAYALSALFHFLISLLPFAVAGTLICAMPFASVAIAWKCNARLHEKPGLDISQNVGRNTTFSFDLMRKPLLAALLFGIAYGIVNGTMRTPGAGDANTLMYAVVHLLASEATLVAMLFYLNAQRSDLALEERFVIVYRFALLLMAGSLLFGLLFDSMNFAVQVILLAGYTCFRIVLWTILGKISNAQNANPTMVFSLGEASLTIGLTLGTTTTQMIAMTQQLPVFEFRMIMTISTAMIIVVYLFVLNERQTLAIVGLLGVSSENQRRHNFQMRCSAVSEQYGLSNRENEVMRLFVRGRSAARIAEDLYISKGTVTTHLRNIYRKTDVHSRQELLDLLDAEASESSVQ